MAGLDLGLLAAFEAVYLERSVSQAALRLGVRQPTISAALARLRDFFADELFLRSGGAMQPTPKAVRLAPRINHVLSELRKAVDDEAPFSPDTETRVFTIVSNDYATFVLGPPIVEIMAREAPHVDLRMIAADKAEVPGLLEKGLADVAIGVFPSPPDRFVVQTLFTEHFVGVARENHPILERPITPEAFAAADHALFTTRRDASGEVDKAFLQRGLRRRISLTLPHFLALPEILARSDMVASIPSRAARFFVQSGLSVFDLPLSIPRWTLSMVWSPTTRHDPAATWLRSRILGAAQRL
ncbi:LysR family transcriptional regulator [Brevundimonas sp.]|uniref:LysR family transcriptional regulator n=1 Tax=Brevundimonas sp. TaxID=1871086 RepID=UPI002631DB2D|nr:LysR family transcriptional regulator [Brevundimonas sp.]